MGGTILVTGIPGACNKLAWASSGATLVTRTTGGEGGGGGG